MKKAILLLGMALAVGISVVTAQESCPTLIKSITSTVGDACQTVNSGEVCAGTSSIMVNDAGIEVGTNAPLADLTTIVSTGISTTDETWGVAVLNISGGTVDSVVKTIVYGSASLMNTAIQVQGDPAQLPLKNIAGYDVNLRSGAGTNFDTTGTFPADAEAFTDGRSADSQWFRIQTDAGISWVNTSLVEVTGDISNLPVLDSPYTEPFQSFILESDSSDTGCGFSTSGVLLQYNGEANAKLNINGADLTFSNATLLVQANATLGLQIQVLDGTVSVTANKNTLSADGGEALQVVLDDTSLLVNDVPQFQENYVYANVAGAPLDLVTIQDGALCITGVPLGAETIQAWGGPSTDYSELAPLQSDAHYNVAGFALDANNATWIKLDNGRWIEAVNANVIGACVNYAEVEAPPLTAMSVVSANQSFVPTQNTRFQAYSGSDVMTGTCTSAPIAVCDHLAVVVVNPDGSLGWRGQEPIVYPLTAQETNRYTYSGRNFQNNANLSLDLTFTSATAWSMTMTTIYDSDPTCTHTFYYTAAKL